MNGKISETKKIAQDLLEMCHCSLHCLVKVANYLATLLCDRVNGQWPGCYAALLLDGSVRYRMISDCFIMTEKIDRADANRSREIM